MNESPLSPSVEPETGTMQINLPNLVKTLGEHLYSDPNVAIREVVQNAHDACSIARLTAHTSDPPVITILADSDALRLTVIDNGIGLTREEIDQFLTVIGSSHTDVVRSELRSLGRGSEAGELIGRFGLGLLSAFTIGHRVEFMTRSRVSGTEVIRWWCDGGTDWKLERVGAGGQEFPFGTTVTVSVDAKHVGLLNYDYLRPVVGRYTEFLDFPVLVGPDGEQVNIGQPPWMTGGDEAEFRTFLEHRYPYDEIVAVIPVDITDGASGISVQGALFIPEAAALLVEEYGDVAIYCHRYFVCADNRTLLPTWARFVRGVVDSPDLREMTDRERVVEDAVFERIRDLLGARILAYLDDLANTNPTLLNDIVRRQNITIKSWALMSDELFRCIRDRALFDVGGTKQNLADYLASTPMQGTIYYTTAPGAASQFVVLARARGLPVIDASGFPDAHFLDKYAQDVPGVELVDLDRSGLGLIDPVEEPPARWKVVRDYFADKGVNAQLCYFDPGRVPAILTREPATELALEDLDELLMATDIDQTIKRYLRATRDRLNFEHDRRGTSGEQLSLNARSAIIKSVLEFELGASDLADVLDALYNNALLLSYHGSADEVAEETLQQVFDGQARVVAALLAHAARRSSEDGAAERLEDVGQATGHVVCFVAVPFSPEYDRIQTALERVLGGPPYFFEVSRADRQYFQSTVENNVEHWIKRADCYAVDITGTNANVMMELGLIYWHYRDRQLLLLCERDQPDISDLKGQILIRYPSGDATVEAIEAALREEIDKIPQLQGGRFQGRQRYLSTVALSGVSWLAEASKEAIADSFDTIEEFLAESPESVAHAVGESLPVEFVPKLQAQVSELINRPPARA